MPRLVGLVEVSTPASIIQGLFCKKVLLEMALLLRFLWGALALMDPFSKSVCNGVVAKKNL